MSDQPTPQFAPPAAHSVRYGPVQTAAEPAGFQTKWWHWALVVLMPVAGLVLAIIAWSKKKVGLGFGYLVVGIVALNLWSAVLVATASPTYESEPLLDESTYQTQTY
jgi:hypothetical protein